MPLLPMPSGVGANQLIRRLRAADAEIYGTLYANAGVIGGVSIGANGLQSSNYAAGSVGWLLNSSGLAEFNNVTVRGELSANNVTGWLTTNPNGGFRTSASGERVEISGSNTEEIKFYNANNYLVGTLGTDGTGYDDVALVAFAENTNSELLLLSEGSGSGSGTGHIVIRGIGTSTKEVLNVHTQQITSGQAMVANFTGFINLGNEYEPARPGVGIYIQDPTSHGYGKIRVHSERSPSRPDYSFYGDTDTGMYLQGGGAIGFTANGSLSFLVRNADVIVYKPLLAQLGSAAAPSHSFQGDPDIGMYRYGTNVIGFSSQGVVRALIGNNGLAVGGYCVTPIPTSYAMHAVSDSGHPAGGFYKKINTSNSSVLHVRSDVGGTNSLVWYVDSDGDAVKASDPKLKSSIKPARSYWEDWKRLGKSGALIQHGWKGAKDKARLTNWDASKIAKVFPKLAPVFEDEDTGEKRLMVNYSALDLISHRVLMEAVERIERLEERVEELENGIN